MIKISIVTRDLDEFNTEFEKRIKINRNYAKFLKDIQEDSLKPYQDLVKNLKTQTNKYFWKKMSMLIVMGVISFFSIYFNQNLVALLGILGLDGLGVGINFSDITGIYHKKFKIISDLEEINSIFDTQIGKFHNVQLKSISLVQLKINAMLESLDPLLEIRLSDSDFEQRIKILVQNLREIANTNISKFSSEDSIMHNFT